MLYEFLKKEKDEILLLTEEKTLSRAGLRMSSDRLKQGLPIFFDQLVAVLEEKLGSHPTDELLEAAADHGKEFLRLGYTLSHVVHSYGAICQIITGLAVEKGIKISTKEFKTLNSCLDEAIAAAVSEFQYRSVEASEAKEVQHLGFLVHELRNALSSTTVAHEMIRQGLVGTNGSTAEVLGANLTRMRQLIDRSLSEVRMKSDAKVFVEKFRLIDLFDQIVMTAKADAEKKKQVLDCDVNWKIEIEADRQLLLSAVANLVQNAIKYTKEGGKIWLRAKAIEDRVSIEVEDECGGIDPKKIDSLFTPYVRANKDKSGLGLGLSITQRAIRLSEGKVSVKNLPRKGCIFTIDIPQKISPELEEEKAAVGQDMVYSKSQGSDSILEESQNMR